MNRWTTSYPLTTSNCSGNVDAHSVAIGSDVLLFLKEDSDMPRMFIFQPDNGKVTRFSWKVFGNKDIKSINYHDGKVYIWLYESDNWPPSYILYKLDLKTMKLEAVMEKRLGRWRGDTQVIDGFMYILEEDTAKMHVINLDTMEVMGYTLTKEFPERHYCRNLIIQNGKLLLMKRSDIEHTASIIKMNGENLEVKKIYGEKHSKYIPDLELDNLIGSALNKSQSAQDFILPDYFNVEKLKWITHRVERNVFDYEEKILTYVKIENTVYAVTKTLKTTKCEYRPQRCGYRPQRDHKVWQVDIRALELRPSLTTRCLLSIIDSGSKKALKKARENETLRPRVYAMSEWRLALKAKWDTNGHFESLAPRFWEQSSEKSELETKRVKIAEVLERMKNVPVGILIDLN